MSEPAEAVIMAGGRGTRLHPYTAVLPKPLMPVGDRAVLEWLLLHLRRHGIRSVILAVNHLRQLIQAYFGDGTALGLRIEYVVEEQPLGTAGPLGLMLGRLAPQVIVANGDLLTDLDVAALTQRHRATGADATIAAMRREHQVEYGVLDTAEDGALTAWREKPRAQHLVSMGLNVIRRDAMADHLHPNTPMNMPDLLTRMAVSGERVLVAPQDALWLDIGRPEDYARAQTLAEVSDRPPFGRPE